MRKEKRMAEMARQEFIAGKYLTPEEAKRLSNDQIILLTEQIERDTKYALDKKRGVVTEKTAPTPPPVETPKTVAAETPPPPVPPPAEPSPEERAERERQTLLDEIDRRLSILQEERQLYIDEKKPSVDEYERALASFKNIKPEDIPTDTLLYLKNLGADRIKDKSLAFTDAELAVLKPEDVKRTYERLVRDTENLHRRAVETRMRIEYPEEEAEKVGKRERTRINKLIQQLLNPSPALVMPEDLIRYKADRIEELLDAFEDSGKKKSLIQETIDLIRLELEKKPGPK
jgi:hypothetical protein